MPSKPITVNADWKSLSDEELLVLTLAIHEECERRKAAKRARGLAAIKALANEYGFDVEVSVCENGEREILLRP